MGNTLNQLENASLNKSLFKLEILQFRILQKNELIYTIIHDILGTWECDSRSCWVDKGEIMPKRTFMNLPSEKRERIENAAIEEFATYTFRDASINRIINDVGIAKGSFINISMIKGLVQTYR